MTPSSRSDAPGAGRRAPRWWRAPALHFSVIGGALFGLVSLVSESGAAWRPRPTIAVDDARIARLSTTFAQRWGRAPRPEQLTALIEQAIDDEILEREARRLGLAEGDLAIRQRLIAKMRAVTDDPGASEQQLLDMAARLGFDEDVIIARLLRQKMIVLLRRDPRAGTPTDAELETWLREHGERFRQPPTVDFWHVFISRALHGDGLEARAATVARTLRDRALTPEEAMAYSDPFPLAAAWRGRTEAAVARRFGTELAEQVMTRPARTWSDPVATRYGLHLLWVDRRLPSEPPKLETIRAQVVRAYEEARAATRLASELGRLREAYRVEVDRPVDDES